MRNDPLYYDSSDMEEESTVDTNNPLDLLNLIIDNHPKRNLTGQQKANFKKSWNHSKDIKTS